MYVYCAVEVYKHIVYSAAEILKNACGKLWEWEIMGEHPHILITIIVVSIKIFCCFVVVCCCRGCSLLLLSLPAAAVLHPNCCTAFNYLLHWAWIRRKPPK